MLSIKYSTAIKGTQTICMPIKKLKNHCTEAETVVNDTNEVGVGVHIPLHCTHAPVCVGADLSIMTIQSRE